MSTAEDQTIPDPDIVSFDKVSPDSREDSPDREHPIVPASHTDRGTEEDDGG